MASCCYHVEGSTYKVGNEIFKSHTEAVEYARSVMGTVHQIRPDGRKFLFYSAVKELKLKKSRKS